MCGGLRSLRAAGAAVAGAICLGACGGGTTTVTVSGGAGPAATQTARPATSQSTGATAASTSSLPTELLFAVVEAHGRDAQQGFIDDTVAIVGLDGVARSKAAFTPRTPPQIGNAAPILQPEARVASGRVFYIDGKGVVRSLAPMGGGTPAIVTTFGAAAPQGYESFAVSPDGRHLIASVDVLTPFQTPAPNDQNNPFGSGGDQDHDAIETADAGGGAHTSYMLDRPQHPLFVAGWDSTSPIGITDPALGTQDGLPAGWGGPVARLDASGHPGPALCSGVEGLPDGTILCADSDSGGSPSDIASVHGAASGDWTVPLMPGFFTVQDAYGDGPHLSPDAATVVYAVRPTSGQADPTTYAMSRGGAPRKLADGYTPQGFLDADTVVVATAGNGPTGELGLVHLSGGGVTDLGFRGLFVGVVQSAR